MTDFQQARYNMVESQIHPSDVTDYAILDAFMSVPREQFVNAAQRTTAYIDEDIAIGTETGSRYLMEPMVLAKLVQLAEIKRDNVVLDIGCATGYSTAILAQLCSSVVALECDDELAAQAGDTLMELGVDNAVVVNGALEKGYAKEGPYDVIFIGGAVGELPQSLGDQLKEGGRLVTVEGTSNHGVARLYVKKAGILGGRDVFNSAVQPLPGFDKPHEFVF